MFSSSSQKKGKYADPLGILPAAKPQGSGKSQMQNDTEASLTKEDKRDDSDSGSDNNDKDSDSSHSSDGSSHKKSSDTKKRRKNRINQTSPI